MFQLHSMWYIIGLKLSMAMVLNKLVGIIKLVGVMT